ncbi:uncharacterized protein [Dermacentor albipictus]|uniref:uncharacterized protein n=1 Tax=Dermacentor albipictus TaxID=60249 RepID=UPI0031FC83E7
MRSFSFVAFTLLVAQIFILFCKTEASRGPNKLQRETPNSFKIFDIYDNAIAVMDIDGDAILDCLSARREDYDPVAKSVTYVWSIAAPDGSGRKYVPFHFTEGDTPDTVQFTITADGDDDTGTAKFVYTDYKNCAILEVPHFGDQCTLWVTEDVQDSIPEHCLEQFADICGNGISVHDADKCKGVDTQNK